MIWTTSNKLKMQMKNLEIKNKVKIFYKSNLQMQLLPASIYMLNKLPWDLLKNQSKNKSPLLHKIQTTYRLKKDQSLNNFKIE